MAGLEVIQTALAAVLFRRDSNGCKEGSDDKIADPPLRFLEEGRERSEGRLTTRCGPMTPDLDLVEDPFSQPSQPAVESGEVRLESASLRLLHRRAVSPGAVEIRPHEFMDHGNRVKLSGK